MRSGTIHLVQLARLALAGSLAIAACAHDGASTHPPAAGDAPPTPTPTTPTSAGAPEATSTTMITGARAAAPATRAEDAGIVGPTRLPALPPPGASPTRDLGSTTSPGNTYGPGTSGQSSDTHHGASRPAPSPPSPAPAPRNDDIDSAPDHTGDVRPPIPRPPTRNDGKLDLPPNDHGGT